MLPGRSYTGVTKDWRRLMEAFSQAASGFLSNIQRLLLLRSLPPPRRSQRSSCAAARRRQHASLRSLHSLSWHHILSLLSKHRGQTLAPYPPLKRARLLPLQPRPRSRPHPLHLHLLRPPILHPLLILPRLLLRPLHLLLQAQVHLPLSSPGLLLVLSTSSSPPSQTVPLPLLLHRPQMPPRLPHRSSSPSHHPLFTSLIRFVFSTSQPTATPTASRSGTTLVAGSAAAATDASVSYKRFSSTVVVAPSTQSPVVTGAASGESTSSKGYVPSAFLFPPSSHPSFFPSHSFFDNKGAVVAVFVIVGLVGLAGIFMVVTYFMRRRNRRREEEDEEYFEKYNEPSPIHHRSQSAGFTNYGGLGQSATDLTTTPAGPGAYPDRSVHYGVTDNGTGIAYDQPQGGVEYPPGTAFAAAATQRGQYQYQPHGAPYTTGQLPPSPLSHPFAHPVNLAQTGGAPAVNRPYVHHIDSYYGGTTDTMGHTQ